MLKSAVETNQVEYVQILIKYGADFNCGNSLCLAVKCNNSVMLDLLLQSCKKRKTTEK